MDTAAPADAPDRVRSFLLDLQDRICAALEEADGEARFRRDEFPGERGGVARPRVLEDGGLLERAAVNFSHSRGSSLPPAATERKPELAGLPYEAVSLSLIVHPRNPHVPTTHANFRWFQAAGGEQPGSWWFGGGYDLTPYYPEVEDCVHWHRTAREACLRHGPDLHPVFKEACDRYFFLPHRGEPRGIGGVFFDDWNRGGFEAAFALVRDLADSFLPAYLPILERRRERPWTEEEREFQLLRRGRYVEFNLVHDRGTLFGLQAGGRTESILASLPPRVAWRYGWKPRPGSREERLLTWFLVPRDWASGGPWPDPEPGG